jgi:hypothetical protein
MWLGLGCRTKKPSTASVRNFCLFFKRTGQMILRWIEYSGSHSKPEAAVNLGQFFLTGLKEEEECVSQQKNWNNVLGLSERKTNNLYTLDEL